MQTNGLMRLPPLRGPLPWAPCAQLLDDTKSVEELVVAARSLTFAVLGLIVASALM